MEISLKQFLMTGALGNLHVGDTEAQVRDLLGTPDAEGDAAHPDRPPSFLKYGDVKFHFAPLLGAHCYLIEIKRRGGAKQFVFPAAWTVGDWDLPPGSARITVETCLIKLGLRFTTTSVSFGQGLTVLSSHVRITFDEDELWSFAAMTIPEDLE